MAILSSSINSVVWVFPLWYSYLEVWFINLYTIVTGKKTPSCFKNPCAKVLISRLRESGLFLHHLFQSTRMLTPLIEQAFESKLCEFHRV